jgi:hypothetical protein
MIMKQSGPVLPRFVSNLGMPTARLERLIARLIPVLRWLERGVRPRWTTPFQATKRLLGIVILMLSVTMLTPLPFGNLMPILVVVLLAFAFLERDGLLLTLALLGALTSLAMTAASLWGTIEAGLLL